MHFLRLSPVTCSDLQIVRDAHAELLPVRYADTFYERLVSPDGPFLSIMAKTTPENEIVGVITARIEQVVECLGEQRFGYVMTFGVLQAYRGQGIGTLLLRKMEDLLRVRGCDYMSLHVKVGNNTATDFYRERGLKPVETLADHYLIDNVLYSAVDMRRNLISWSDRVLRRLKSLLGYNLPVLPPWPPTLTQGHGPSHPGEAYCLGEGGDSAEEQDVRARLVGSSQLAQGLTQSFGPGHPFGVDVANVFGMYTRSLHSKSKRHGVWEIIEPNRYDIVGLTVV
eukprot:Rmarinus@m.16526